MDPDQSEAEPSSSAQAGTKVEPFTPKPHRLGRKNTPHRAREAVDEKPISVRQASPKPVKKRRPRTGVADLTPALPPTAKRKRIVSSKYTGLFATAIPTKGARSREMDENYGRDEARGRQPEEDLEDLYYGRRKRTRKPSTVGTNARGSTDGVVPDVLIGSWAKIEAYVSQVAESGMLSVAEGRQLQQLVAQQNEQLRLVHAASSFSLTRFVRNVKKMLVDHGLASC
mmetsp:Transcript_7093/g.14330  ORF Transcript_7093/g.14330 Transcript_7093/m.14330 type:complete len:227 (+) Transcript_7093:122-802(+)